MRQVFNAPYGANSQEEEEVAEEEEEAVEEEEDHQVQPHLMLTSRSNPLNKPKM